VPRLPPARTRRPAAPAMAATKLVTVLLPLVPGDADHRRMHRAARTTRRRRAPRSRAARAVRAIGSSSETPGDISTLRRACRAGRDRRTQGECPASAPGTRVPRAPAATGANRSQAAAIPCFAKYRKHDAPVFAETHDHACHQRIVQGRETRQNEHETDNPETHDDLGLRPALEFEMVMQGRPCERCVCR